MQPVVMPCLLHPWTRHPTYPVLVPVRCPTRPAFHQPPISLHPITPGHSSPDTVACSRHPSVTPSYCPQHAVALDSGLPPTTSVLSSFTQYTPPRPHSRLQPPHLVYPPHGSGSGLNPHLGDPLPMCADQLWDPCTALCPDSLFSCARRFGSRTGAPSGESASAASRRSFVREALRRRWGGWCRPTRRCTPVTPTATGHPKPSARPSPPRPSRSPSTRSTWGLWLRSPSSRHPAPSPPPWCPRPRPPRAPCQGPGPCRAWAGGLPGWLRPQCPPGQYPALTPRLPQQLLRPPPPPTYIGTRVTRVWPA